MFRDRWNRLKKGPSGGPGSFINKQLDYKDEVQKYQLDSRDVMLTKEGQDLIILTELKLIILQIHL